MATGSTDLAKYWKDEGSRILQWVHEGMEVYDSKGDRIGKVRNLYMGTASEEAVEKGTGPAAAQAPQDLGHTILDDFARALGGDVDMPETLRNRLLYEGYIRIDTKGLFASDYYATPEQIDVVSGEKVHLSVTKDKLIKRDW